MSTLDEHFQQGSAASGDAGVVPAATTGILVGFRAEGQIPLVMYPGQPGAAALEARSVVDLHGAHIGRTVVLMFDRSDPARPLIMGCIRPDNERLPLPVTSPVEVDADGERLVVTASNQLVLRCGKARITLTKAGKVLIEGAYVLSRSSGVNRIKGGSVQIN
jgi:hypothetical protein